MVKDPYFIIDVTQPENGCDGCFTAGVDVPAMNSEAAEGLPLHMRWATSDGSPWWLRSTLYNKPVEGSPTELKLSPSGHYHATCYLDLSGALGAETNFADADSVTFRDDNCNYHSKSYFCQNVQQSLTPKEGSPEGCTCKRVQLTGEYSAKILIKCEKCLDVYKSTDKNSCPSGTKIFSPASREDWKTFIGSADPLRSPNFIIDITRPSNGCGGTDTECTSSAMNSGIPAQATWTTSDASPWWLRDTKYGSPTGNYDANCYMTILSQANENSITFGNDACKFHSRSYYCQSLHTTTTTTLAVEGVEPPAADSPSTEWESEGRKVFLYKTAAHVDVRTQTAFCTDKSLHWFSPKSQADAQALITNAYNADNHHTWIQLYQVTMAEGGHIGGYQVTLDDASCSAAGIPIAPPIVGIEGNVCASAVFLTPGATSCLISFVCAAATNQSSILAQVLFKVELEAVSTRRSLAGFSPTGCFALGRRYRFGYFLTCKPIIFMCIPT